MLKLAARTVLQKEAPCNSPPAPPTNLLLLLSARMAFYLISSALPHSRLLRMALPAGPRSLARPRGSFVPIFHWPQGGEKARLFRISMTMACNAVTGVAWQTACKIPGQQSRQAEKAGRGMKIFFNHPGLKTVPCIVNGQAKRMKQLVRLPLILTSHFQRVGWGAHARKKWPKLQVRRGGEVAPGEKVVRARTMMALD